VVEGKRTIWPQQADALTLAPVSGRNFEPVALATGESADLLLYLMSLPKPSAAVLSAVADGVAYLKATAIVGQDWVGGRGTEGGRHLAAKAGAGPIWPRYLNIATGKAIFGDRDKTIHDDVSELSPERRNGYAWYSGGPQRAIDAYAEWSKAHQKL
jgi:PelA/Pel-15E family pectate lyase